MLDQWVTPVAAALVASALVACGGGSDPAPPVVATCPTTALPSGPTSTAFTLAAWPDRGYHLVLPASHECGKPMAVAIVLHGGGGNKENMRTLTCPGGDLASVGCLHRQLLAAGFAVVLPNGSNSPGGKLVDPNGLRTWNAGGGHVDYICVSGYLPAGDRRCHVCPRAAR